MPTIISAKQPTFAIITAQYCEKVAVDALIEDKETYVRYTTLGEWSDGFSSICYSLFFKAIFYVYSLLHFNIDMPILQVITIVCRTANTKIMVT